MTITVKDLLEHAYVLTVNKHRLARFYRTFQSRGLVPLPRPYSGRIVDRQSAEWRINRHYVAAHMSHFEICEKARKDNWPYVCIFEEDAIPCMDVYQRLSEHLIDIPDDAVVCKLGYVRCSGETLSLPCTGKFERITESKFAETSFAGSHAYIVFKSFYAQNTIMLSRYRELLEVLKDRVPVHNPSLLSKVDVGADWWFYEWLMTPKVYRNRLQSRIYHVETRCNLFSQADYVTWDAESARWFGLEFAPSRVRRALRVIAAKAPLLYEVWRSLANRMGRLAGK